MKKIIRWLTGALVLLTVFAPAAFADECAWAFDGMLVTKDTVLCNKAFDVPSGITIKTDGVTLDCNGAIIRGTGLQDGQGIIIDHASGVTVKNCNILNYDAGVYVKEGNRNTIIQNALLKNKVGVRMLQAFENRFESNADKSILKPVSALASKFNSFWITNKELDRDFCEVNLCNQPGPMNACADNDFYCSPSCTYENDKDCPAPAPELEPVTEYPKLASEPPASVQVALPTEPATTQPQKHQAPARTTASFMDLLPEKTRFWVMTLVFVIAYLTGFLAFQHHHAHTRN